MHNCVHRKLINTETLFLADISLIVERGYNRCVCIIFPNNCSIAKERNDIGQ